MTNNCIKTAHRLNQNPEVSDLSIELFDGDFGKSDDFYNDWMQNEGALDEMLGDNPIEGAPSIYDKHEREW